MARRNQRGLELSFKWYGKGRKGGRWYTRKHAKGYYRRADGSPTGEADRIVRD